MNTFNIEGKILDLSTAKVMGILNITTDSFFDGGECLTKNKILDKCRKMLLEGASIIDVGAQSSRPGAKPVDFEIEKKRLLTAISYIKQYFPDIIISVDTYNAEIARTCLLNGANIINDISGGEMDKEMFETVADLNAPYIMMHMQGTPEVMQEDPQYKNVVDDILIFFEKKIKQLKNKGFQKIIIDPGFGFGKKIEHNYQLLNNLRRFKKLKLPVLIGVSRKSMIYNLLDTNTDEALNGTSIINTIAIQNGANILRVHDVKEAIECIKITTFAKNNC